MTVYCDRLSLRLALRLAVDRLRGGGPSAVQLLDGQATGVAERLVATLLRRVGISVAEVPFFAGHLRTRSGAWLPAAVLRAAFEVADHAADRLVNASPRLRRVNEAWQRDTVRLHLAKQLWADAQHVLLRASVAASLSGEAPRPRVYLRWPPALPTHTAGDPLVPADVIPCGRLPLRRGTGRTAASLWLLRQAWRGMRAAGRPPITDGRPSVLLLQEDDLSLDRSFRTQPHWLDPAEPPFRTIVLRVGRLFDNHLGAEEATRAGIEVCDIPEVAGTRASTPVARALGADVRALLSEGLLARNGARALAANETVRLLSTARELARFVVARGITAFVVSETYLLHADAMFVIGPHLPVRTIGYQYGNIPHPSLALIATADQFVTFSAAFDAKFRWPGYPAPAFTHAGYPFDGSFPLTAPRARERRERLRRHGVEFVIGFFDESVQSGKYGWVSADDYADELLMLLEAVDTDPTLGLIVKTQFHHNLRTASRIAAALERATATGRVELPAHGRHRNVVLPGEVAQSCDITIGHVFGGTASLESALAGCRSVLIDVGGITDRDAPYRRADVLFGSMAEARDAITQLRQDDRPALGDWSPILRLFDPYRDGGSAARLRETIAAAAVRA